MFSSSCSQTSLELFAQYYSAYFIIPVPKSIQGMEYSPIVDF